MARQKLGYVVVDSIKSSLDTYYKQDVPKEKSLK